jgi:hypothetical protein
MITNWVKGWEDGRQEPGSFSPEAIDTSSIDFDVILEKRVRSISDDITEMSGLNISNPYDSSVDFKALDAKIYKIGESEILYIVYARPNLQGNYDLYFSKYNVSSGVWLISPKLLSSSGFVQLNRKATINRFEDSGILWVCYQYDLPGEDAKAKIMSLTSSNDGDSWVTRLIKEDGVETVYVEENNALLSTIKPITRKGKGWTAHASYPNALGGYMDRSSTASTKGNTYYQFEASGTDFWLYTYTTSKIYSGSTYWVGKITIYIDNKPQGSYNLHKYDAAGQSKYGRRIKLNTRGSLAQGKHTIKIEHNSGKYFFVDGFEIRRKKNIMYFLDDAIIRNQTSLDSKEAIVVLGVYDSAKRTRNLLFLVDNEGAAANWANAGHVKSDYYRKDGNWYTATEDMQCVMHENTRGLYFTVQIERNKKNVLQTFYWSGSSSTTPEFTAPTWSFLYEVELPGGGGSYDKMRESKAIRYTKAMSQNMDLALFVTNMRGLNKKKSMSQLYEVGISGAVDIPPINFGINSKYAPLLAVNVPDRGSYENSTCAMLCCNRTGGLALYFVKISASTVALENMSDFVSQLNITHDDSSDASTLELEFDNVDNLISSRNEFGLFYETLPTNYWDRSLRVVRVVAKYKMDDFYIKAPIFTGILGGVSETHSNGRRGLSITAYDYTKLLKSFVVPYILVYANAPLEWYESAKDYINEVIDGDTVPVEPRAKNTFKVKDEEFSQERTITTGWDHDQSKNTEGLNVFRVQTDDGVINQSGYGYLVSPDLGKGKHYAGCEFTVNTLPTDGDVNRRFFRFGFQTRAFKQAVEESSSHAGNSQDSGFLVFDTYNNIVKLCAKDSGRSSTYNDSIKQFFVVPGVTYRIEITCFGREITAKIKQGDSELVLTCTRRATYKDAMCVHIGSGSANINIDWSNIYIRKYDETMKLPLKNDGDVAYELIGRAFQGMLPLKKSAKYDNDYFTSLIVSYEAPVSDALDRLALQSYKQWYFDYDGSLVWADAELEYPLYTISDNDMSSVTLTYDPTQFKNWVEVVTQPSEESTAQFQNVYTRVSRADITSIMTDGLRYEQVNLDSLYTKEQADKVALAKLYESNESMEGCEISLNKPLVFLVPRDELILDSKSLFPSGINSKYMKTYHIKQVTIGVSYGEVSVSLSTVSRWRARQSMVVELYNEGGVTLA